MLKAVNTVKKSAKIEQSFDDNFGIVEEIEQERKTHEKRPIKPMYRTNNR